MLDDIIISALGQRGPGLTPLGESQSDGTDPATADTELRGTTAFAAMALAICSGALGCTVRKGTGGLPTGRGTFAPALGAGCPLLMLILGHTEAQPMADLSNVFTEEGAEVRMRSDGGKHVGRRAVL